MRTLIIPDHDNITQSLALAAQYDLGFEYNDFLHPEVLDAPDTITAIVRKYKNWPLPEYSTVHGAFYDVTVASPDSRIRDVSRLRVEQSIAAAREIGARAVIFHSNYNPFLNSREYINSWVEENAAYWKGVMAAHPDMNIYLENIFDSSPDVLSELAGKLSLCRNFGICLDYAHASLSRVPLRDWVMSLGIFVRHIHINDNDLKCDLHLAVGEGKIDWNEFYILYEDYMKSASVLIETTSVKRQKMSLKKLAADGFFKS